MEHDNFKNGVGYFSEISIALRRAGYGIPATEDGLLTVSMDGLPLCQISDNGSVRYRDADIGSAEREDALHQVTQEVETVSEYMRLMETAPLLKAQGLDEDYKLLADFNGVVLAGHHTRFGVQFATWDWDCDRTGVSQGHYMSNYYEAAKQDFAVRLFKNSRFSRRNSLRGFTAARQMSWVTTSSLLTNRKSLLKISECRFGRSFPI